MRKTRSRSTMVLIIALLAIVGLCVFIVKIFLNAGQWIQHSYNGHLAGSGGLSSAGEIFDRTCVFPRR